MIQGRWRAWLGSPGGELPFGLELTRKGSDWRGVIVNGPERIRVPIVAFDGQTLLLDIDYYDSTITARVSQDGTRLDGEWKRRAAGDAWTRMAFHAVHGKAPRFRHPQPGDALHGRAALGHATHNEYAPIDGRWSVRFSSEEQPAVGVFRTDKDDTVIGTFMTATGDYRYLAGDYIDGRLRLSVFDGAHAFLFDARMQTDGTLKGDFWSRDTWHETWTARRDPDAALPDAFSMTRWTGNARLGDLTFPDLEGKPRSLTDPAFAGKARIIEVFGSWCPNCNDATQYLVELHDKYHKKGLAIVALAFEFSGDLKRDTAQVRRYARRHKIPYPILIAGISDKKQASKALPILDRVRSYPTTIFLDHANHIRAVHTGFSGPATGEAHTQLRASFESLVEELLSQP